MLNLTRRNVPSAAASRLYEAAFPLCERRTAAAHVAVTARESQFHACELHRSANGEFAGILYFWHWPEHKMLFVEHLAIVPAFRGQGYGHAALRGLRQKKCCIMLEIEPVTDASTARRLAFYESAGFVRLPCAHVQLPYHEGGEPVPLELLSYREDGEAATPEQVALLERLLRGQVMRKR